MENKGLVDAPWLACQEVLGHVFAAPGLLREALTHRSFINEHQGLGLADNERLEFLGDTVLATAISTLLWSRYPGASEGDLTKRRADQVCEAALADVALAIGLGRFMRLGKGEARSGGASKPRLLASTLEACIGAVYLDSHRFEVACALVERLFNARLGGVVPGARDIKGRLQETLQALGRPVPMYQVVEVLGPIHDPTYVVEASLEDGTRVRAEAPGKLEAEVKAAGELLALLNDGA